MVPEIGRVMQFGLVSADAPASQGPFWRNPNFARWMRPDPDGWINFGGDKAWPAPQSDWQKQVGKAWPPPTTFDARAYVAVALGSKIWMESETDPNYGLAVERVLSLDPVKPVLTIVTTFRKINGNPVRVGVWSITQLAAPERLFVQLTAAPTTPTGKRYESLLTAPAKDLEIEDNLLSMSADPLQKTMIAAGGNVLLWVGAGPSLLMEASAVLPGVGGSAPSVGAPRAQIYTSAGQRYVELEFVAPVTELHPGDHATLTVAYTLIPRVEADVRREAKRILTRAPAPPPPPRRARVAPTR